MKTNNWLSFIVGALYVLSVPSIAATTLLKTFNGQVGAGNYSHFSILEDGLIKIEVITVMGDADLYVCERNKKCTFYNYDWQSISYGIDEVLVTEDVRRPVTFSVYGHPYYEKSNFILNKYEMSTNKKSYNTHDFESHENYFEHNKKTNNDHEFISEPSETPEKHSDTEDMFSDYENETEQESILVTLLFHLIKFLAEVIL